ncbi:LysR family transcriptional regulator [Bacillus aerolatus]|uniref:LysR family transcriptional regulator n=1 Tax=Bacillus aerolatus TaxID=2653354 RepID=A0A6I1FYF5_9BACI|nr:LysR family transcriptional regulator [Bacillus aerolatus]KAB7708148.1 LysR family transcriptional regulator [Bacillus aerolatus]
MSIAKFEVFRAVVDLGSLSKAAESLGLTQSAVSHAIAGMESEFGFTLLTRGRSGANLTENGERILLHVREILKWNEQMMQEVATINGIEKGIVRIGTFPSVSIQWLPEIIKRFTEQFPLIKIKLFEGNYDEINEWIANGTVDFGFVSLPAAKSLDALPLKNDRLLCLVSDAHTLYNEECLSFGQLKNEAFIMPKSSIDNDVRRILTKHKVKPNVKYETSEDQAIISMVQNNLGISILPEMILYRLPNNVRAIELEGGYYRTIGIAAPSLKKMSPAAKKMIETLRKWLSA